jgi:hypothetical protein
MSTEDPKMKPEPRQQTLAEIVADYKLNQRSLRAFKPLFSTLELPAVADLCGVYSGQFVGPRWVRLLAGPTLRLGGLPGWWGKSLDGEGQGTNLLMKRGELVHAVPITLQQVPSRIDDQMSLTVFYPPRASFPLPWVIDELRHLTADTALGMTMITAAGLYRFPFPFLLHLQHR